MMSKAGLAAFLAPLVLLLFYASNIFLGNHRSEHTSVSQQNRMAGRWTIDIPAGAQKARLVLRPQQNSEDWASVHVPLTQLQGLNSPAPQSGESRFQLARDAGTFDFTGSFQSGRGTGEWTFKSNSSFLTESRKYGYDQFSEEHLYKLALNDIGAAYLGELARAGYRNLSLNDLISLYSNNVRAPYIVSLESVGYSKLSPRDLIALKTNGVTETYIKSLQDRGYKNLSVERILSLRTNPGNEH